MQGASNSLLTKIKEKMPDVFVLKCFCQSFHLVACYACKKLSRSAEQLVHDIYNYFKNSCNRIKSLEEFQHFCSVEPYKMLRPCQTQWLSLSQCVNRILNQWRPLELFFTAEALEAKSSQGEKILQGLKSCYVKATLEFLSFVLEELTGLIKLFQSNQFQLHILLVEVQRVVKMFCINFMDRTKVSSFFSVNVHDQSKWLPLHEVYPGYCAQETIKLMRPHEKESFLARCREWYIEALRQISSRINASDPVLKAMQSLNPLDVVNGKSSIDAISVLVTNLPQLMGSFSNLQSLDRQWRSPIADDSVRSELESKPIEEFWKFISEMDVYKTLGLFVLQITALPQGTAEVERLFSKINLNKTKLRNALAIQTFEAIVKVSHRFPANFEVDQKLLRLHRNARANYMSKYSSNDCENVEELESYEI